MFETGALLSFDHLVIICRSELRNSLLETAPWMEPGACGDSGPPGPCRVEFTVDWLGFWWVGNTGLINYPLVFGDKSAHGYCQFTLGRRSESSRTLS